MTSVIPESNSIKSRLSPECETNVFFKVQSDFGAKS